MFSSALFIQSAKPGDITPIPCPCINIQIHHCRVQQDVPPGVSPLPDPHGSQPSLDVQTDQKQTVIGISWSKIALIIYDDEVDISGWFLGDREEQIINNMNHRVRFSVVHTVGEGDITPIPCPCINIQIK